MLQIRSFACIAERKSKAAKGLRSKEGGLQLNFLVLNVDESGCVSLQSLVSSMGYLNW